MIRYATVFNAEMHRLDDMSRSHLVEAVRGGVDSLPVDLRERVEEQDTEWLRLLLFAARLIHALRQWRQGREQTSQPTAG
jgi:hypothetical protein